MVVVMGMLIVTLGWGCQISQNFEAFADIQVPPEEMIAIIVSSGCRHIIAIIA